MLPVPRTLAMICFLVGLPMATFAQEESDKKHTVSIGTYYSTGDYGEALDTRIRYFPLSYRYQGPNWSAQLTIPHLEIDGLGNVLVNVGGVTRARASTARLHESGLGDTVATLTYQLPSSSDSGPFFDLVLEAKLPTADEAKSLGTGEADYGLQLDLFQSLGNATVFGSLGYRFRGESELYSGLEDGAFGELGISLPVAATVSTGLIYDYSEPASELSKEIHEFLPYVSWELSDAWSLMGYVVFGLTEDSPDRAAGLQLSWHW